MHTTLGYAGLVLLYVTLFAKHCCAICSGSLHGIVIVYLFTKHCCAICSGSLHVVVYLFAKHCCAICSGSLQASIAFSIRVRNANKLSVSFFIPSSLSSTSFSQYLMSSILWSVKQMNHQQICNIYTFWGYLVEKI